MNDEVFSINLVEEHIATSTPQRVHVTTLPVRIDIAKGLTCANDSDMCLLNRLLVEFRAVFVLKSNVLVDIIVKNFLYGQLKLTSHVID